jgi:hypothetical protein
VKPEDLDPTKGLFAALMNVPRETALWATLRALIAAMEMNVEEIRYLLLWVALEALFGTSYEITYRISQRIALFIGKDNSDAKAVFGDDAKKAYGFRSKVAHGAWRKNKDSTALTATSEALIRRALNRILMETAVTPNFLGSNDQRESFLDEQIFI